ncbi:U4/U6 small nuclear ribonucleoprotein prp4 [Vermiconidia calcicola]|uniref:U4/U6 small nuclear ribonucleoprotein prp4 n=1 Tax=Vermiconidia calcicola TaxID=1690605 RepID=A0ACC3NF68_9PEZI|nr:U4/U6 small nuclear ribonucleoprotein prp4 [Vermiconidia calcicola]
MSPRSPSPLSEGEIVSGDEEKAISTSTNEDRDSRVNMSARLSAGSSSRATQLPGVEGLMHDPYFHFRDDDGVVRYIPPEPPSRRDRSRSRSPYRANKPGSGDKRRHEDDHYSRKAASDPRRFKVHYENDRPPRDFEQRSRRPYADPDRPDQPKGNLSYDDGEERGRDTSRKAHQGRGDGSRSPFRHGRTLSNVEKQSDQKRASTPSFNERESTPQSSHGQNDAKLKISLSQHARSNSQATTDASQGDNKQREEQGQTNESQQQLTEAELIEQRRKRREAIKARHKNNPPLLVQALEQNMASAPATPLHDSSGGPSEQHSPPSSVDSPNTPQQESPPASPAAFAVNNDEELVDRRTTDAAANDEDGPSAADYDPNLDMEEDRPDHKRQDVQGAEVNGQGKEPQQEISAAPKQAKDFDMFADDDDDDMFAPGNSATKSAAAGPTQAKTLDESLLDNWDYPDGHYRIILGELLDGRYAVQQQIGKGTFATVVRALDTRTGNAVAVKIACNNETMYKAGQKEMDMLQLLNQNDPEDKKHIIRMLRNFDHKGHLCLVFENLSADLREVLKKFGRNVGLNLKAIRSYAQQMFLSLSHMKKCQILHADLKPDNILVSEKRSVLKICDLGTAAFADDAEVTPYLVSRFYRAPEVILGIPFDYAIDMWSIGCTLFELYTGRILFAGADNNQMLRAIQECRGKFPIRMLKRSTLAEKHFDMDGNFFSQERDKITGKATMRQMNFSKVAPGKDLRSRLSGNTKGMKPDEVKEHAAFVDLMERCLQLDPARRVSPNEALRHGFVTHGTIQVQEKVVPAVKIAMNVPRMR